MHFARALRAAGLPVGPGRVLEALRAVEAVGLRAAGSDLYWTLHSVFVNRRDQRELFDQCFHIFWRDPQLLERMMHLLLPTLRGASRRRSAGGGRAGASPRRWRPRGAGTGEGEQEEEPPELELDAVLTWSDRELLQGKDFEQMIGRGAGGRRGARSGGCGCRSCRCRPGASGPTPHGRAGRPARARCASRCAAAAATIDLARKERRQRHPPLVILCDISGSMSRYSRMLLLFMHAITNDRDRVH